MLVLLNDCKHIAKNIQYYIYTESLYKDWQRLSSWIGRRVNGFQTPTFWGNASPYFERVKVIEGTLKMRTLRDLETSGSDTHWGSVILQKKWNHLLHRCESLGGRQNKDRQSLSYLEGCRRVLQIRNGTATARNTEGWRKEIGAAMAQTWAEAP
jgi:hypothetical protein